MMNLELVPWWPMWYGDRVMEMESWRWSHGDGVMEMESWIS